MEAPNAARRAEFKIEGGRLGKGSFAQVVGVKHRLDGREYAIKRSSEAIVDPFVKLKWLQASLIHNLTCLSSISVASYIAVQ